MLRTSKSIFTTKDALLDAAESPIKTKTSPQGMMKILILQKKQQLL